MGCSIKTTTMEVIFAAFLVAYISLATTGHIVLVDCIAMVIGYAEKEEHYKNSPMVTLQKASRPTFLHSSWA
ncbi:MAG: hypothetical protein JRE40_02710 [Deltaproteobacteria bacterium]|nr:hypothetical protein [Deltaproteobacteria bacterium]